MEFFDRLGKKQLLFICFSVMSSLHIIKVFNILKDFTLCILRVIEE